MDAESSNEPRVEVLEDIVKITIEEDKPYDWESLERVLEKHELASLSGSLEDEIKDLLNRYSKLLDEVVSDGAYDIVKPWFNSGSFYFGELIGTYSFGRINDKNVLVEVVPKISWEAYKKMVEEALITPVLLGSRGVLKSILSSLTFQGLYSPLSYSVLLLDLTREVLSSPLPRRIEQYKVVSEDSVGKPLHHDTYVLMSKGYPLGVFFRLRIEVAYAPLMLLARFHKRLIEDLESLKNAIKEQYQPSSGAVENMLGEINTLVLAHKTLLWTTALREHYITLSRLNLSDGQLVSEAYRQAGFNALLKSVVELYVEYLNKSPLLHAFTQDEPKLNPVASSKIYELWVLSRLLDYLKTTHKYTQLLEEEARDLYLVVNADSIKIYYNMEREAPITTSILGSKLRPDFILKSRYGGCVVLDAKYKRRIESRDLERLLTYIVEYAEPLNNRELYGSLLTLKDTSVREPSALRDKHLGINIKVDIHRLDPRQNSDEVRSVVKKIIGKFNSFIHQA